MKKRKIEKTYFGVCGRFFTRFTYPLSNHKHIELLHTKNNKNLKNTSTNISTYVCRCSVFV